MVTRACECEIHNGYHLTTELGITEILENNNSCPNGLGEIIGTSLRNYAMPFIRYQVGDLATPINYEKCSCGREMPRIMRIEGRKDDVIKDSKGNSIAPVTVRWTFYDMNLDGYQIQQVGEKDYKILVVDSINFNLIRKKFIDSLVHLLGEDSNIDIRIVDKIKRSSFGKIRTTINLMV